MGYSSRNTKILRTLNTKRVRYQKQRRKPLRHLGLSRGDGGVCVQAYMFG